MNDNIQLPEKHHFNLREIADRWSCYTGILFYYIDEGMLRPALPVKELAEESTLFDIETATIIEREQGRDLSSERWCSRHNQPRIPRETLQQARIDRSDVKRFLYINSKFIVHEGTGSFVHEKARSFVSLLEDIDSRLYGLAIRDTRSGNGHRPYFYDLMGIHHPSSKPDDPLRWNRVNVVITREERDRFEQMTGMQRRASALESSVNYYSTPSLDILREAIAEFFEPRRDPDAKREEVVEWINKRFEERGLKPTDNIARAIFTIIKPSDHDPRSRRG